MSQPVSPGDLHSALEAQRGEVRTPVDRNRRRPRRIAGQTERLLRAALVAASVLVLAVVTVSAIHNEGTLELDGNTVNDAGGGTDWNALFDAAGSYTGPAGLLNAFIADYATPDYTYHGGSDKDQDDVSTWECTRVNNPTPKDEILNAYAVLLTGVGGQHAGDQILYFAFERPVNNGNSFMGVWFFQDDVGCDATGGANPGATFPFTGAHSVGDILTLVNFVNGGSIGEIEVYAWVGTGGDSADGTMDLITTSGSCQDATHDERVCGRVNDDFTITTNWPPGDEDLDARQFFEGGINITELLADVTGAGEAPCFSSFMAETRTSQEFTAQLKDYAFDALDSCGEVTASKYLDVNGNGTNDSEPALSGWEMKLYKDNDDSNTLNAGDELVATQDTGAGGSTTFEDVSPGEYVVCETLMDDDPDWYNTDPGAAAPICKAVTVTVGGSHSVAFGNGQPDISITKTCDADVFVGDDIDYTITVTNTGNVDLVNVDLTDTLLGTIASDVSLAAGANAQYTPSMTATDAGTVDNTASVTADYGGTTVWATVDDDADCSTEVWELSVEKDANTSLDRDYDWAISKTRLIVDGEVDGDGDPATLTLAESQTYVVSYEVTVSMTGFTDGNWAVEGTITITNPAPIPANGVAVADLISGVGAATVDCDPNTAGNQATVNVPAEDSADCSYSSDLPDGTDRTNTATATLFGEEYDDTVDVLFDEDTTINEIDECIDVTDDAGTPGDTGDDIDLGEVCLEDLDESDSFTFELYTIEIGPLECGEHEFTNTATFVANDTGETDWADYTIAIDVPCPEGCTLTLGYWKTHNDSFWGGAPTDETWLLIGPDAEETIFFLSGKTYFEVLWTAGGGNAYYQLARQYIAAELNVLAGADDSAIATAFADATTLFNTYTPAEIGALKGKDALRKQFIALAGTLGSFNEGDIGPGHCDEDASSTATAPARTSAGVLLALPLAGAAAVVRRRLRRAQA